jgi:ATP-binding cassette subfamily C protein CydD
LVGTIALAGSAIACGVAFALLLSATVERVFQEGGDLDAVAGLLVGMVALVFARAALLWTSELAGQRAANQVKAGLRERLAAKLVSLGPTYARRERTGELVYAAGEGVETLDAYVTRYAPAVSLAVIGPVLVAAVALLLDRWSFLVLLVAGPFLLLLLGLIGRRVRDLTQRRERELAWMSAHFLDVVRGLPTLKMFGRSAEQADTIESVSRSHGDTTMDVLRTAFQSTLVLEWGATAAIALVAIETSVRLMAGSLGFGRALAVLLLAPEFFLPLRRLSAEYHAGRSGAAAAARVYGILDQPDRGAATAGGWCRSAPASFRVRFDDVRVMYDERREAALAGCSFEIPDGATVALVGASGSGKTTVANVLLRFVEPTRGMVAIDGEPLAAIDPIEWRRYVAYVPQHPSFFQGTVADNLRLARPDASTSEVTAAARAANAHGFISELPDRYGTLIGEGGVRLSGGEQQRLALARAFLKNSPVLILDEPTSHLDAGTEHLVLEAAARLTEGRTSLLITHRLLAASRVDRIVTMSAGRVVDTSTPVRLAPVGGREP